MRSLKKRSKSGLRGPEPKRPAGPFDRPIATNDGHLRRVYHEAHRLKGLQEFASTSDIISEETEKMIIAQAEKLANAVDDFATRSEHSIKPQLSLEIRLLKRAVSFKAHSKGFLPSHQSTANTTALLGSEEEIGKLMSQCNREMMRFAKSLIKGLKPGTAVVWDTDDGDRVKFGVNFATLQLNEARNQTLLNDYQDEPRDVREHGDSSDGDSTDSEDRTAMDMIRLDEHEDITMPRFLVKYSALGNWIRENTQQLHHSNFENLSTKLQPWQLTAVAIIRLMLKCPQKGAILGDGMGLGKTLTAITVSMPEREGPYEGPVLVIAPKVVHTTWLDEFRFHFKEGRQPNVFVLKDKHITTDQLLGGKYDFIITSYHFILNRSHELQFARDTGFLLAQGGATEAKAIGLPLKYRKPWRVNNAVDSGTMGLFGASFRILILDEAHKVKNHEAEMHIATLGMPYDTFLGISGTFLPNKWHDIWGMISFLPNNPFESFEQFLKSFGNIDGSRAPKTCRTDALVSYLDSMVVARPQSIMELDGLIEHEVNAPLGLSTSIAVAIMADEFYRLACISQDDVDDNRFPTGNGNSAAMCKAVEAELVSVSDLLTHRNLADLKTAQFEAWCQKNGTALGQATPDQLLEWVAGGVSRVAKKEKTQARKQARDDADDQDYFDDPKDTYYASGQTELAEDDDEPDGEYYAEQTTGRQGIRRQTWLNELRTADPSTYIEAPRIKAVLQTIMEIHKSAAGDKILVFSKYLRVLDIVAQAIANTSKKNSVLRGFRVINFNGTMSQDARDTARREVQQLVGPVIVLITAGAGGVGLTLTAANHVLMCESWWTRAEELQALSRCYRQGQKRTVHVWRIVSNNSAMELYIRRCAKQKFAITSEIEKKLVREQQHEPAVTWHGRTDYFIDMSTGNESQVKFTDRADNGMDRIQQVFGV